MLLLKTKNGSAVIAKIAGIESTAKIKSVVSIVSKAIASGVSIHAPVFARATAASSNGTAIPGVPSFEFALPARTRKWLP